MTRARDNADKLSGGETIKVETDVLLECESFAAESEVSGLSVMNTAGSCIFSIEESGKMLQQYHPPEDNLSGGPGVILLSNKGGFRVLKGPLLETTKDGGVTWDYCCGEKPVVPPPNIDIPLTQGVTVEFTKIEGKFINPLGTNAVDTTPANEVFSTTPSVRWGSRRNTSEQTSRYKYNCRELPDTDPPTNIIEPPNIDFQFGEFIHINYPTSGGSIDSVELELSIDLNVIYTLNEFSTVYSFTDVRFKWKFLHDETSNTRNAKDCKYDVPENLTGPDGNRVSPCADKVDLSPVSGTENVLSFGNDLGTIRLELKGFAKSELDAFNGVYTDSWFTSEKRENPCILVGSYSVTVPDLATDSPPILEIPPDITDPIDPTIIIGETIIGRAVTYGEEMAGFITEKVYVPSYANPEVIICSASSKETFQPCHCDKVVTGTPSYEECREVGAEGYGTYWPTNVIWALRLPFKTSEGNARYPSSNIEWHSFGAGDQLNNYDRSISRFPGDFDVSERNKKMASGAGTEIWLYTGAGWQEPQLPSWVGAADPYTLEELAVPGHKMIYANTRPAGPDAIKCGATHGVNDTDPSGKITCRQHIVSWTTDQYIP
jgi:hypothetical protein